MKFVVLGIVLFVVWTFYLRKRQEPPRDSRRTARDRTGRMHRDDVDPGDLRSADNVRLLSDDQLDAVDRERGTDNTNQEGARRD